MKLLNVNIFLTVRFWVLFTYILFYTVSQPKLRRLISKVIPSSKSSKDDILKSQTYQQFIKNMDHELKRLEETEQPNNIGIFLIKYKN